MKVDGKRKRIHLGVGSEGTVVAGFPDRKGESGSQERLPVTEGDVGNLVNLTDSVCFDRGVSCLGEHE